MDEEKTKKTFNMFNMKGIIITGVACLLIGALIMFLLQTFLITKDKTVISVKGHNFSKSDVFESMKSYYGLSFALQKIDNALLKEKYKLTDDMKKEVEEQAKGYIDSYKNYGYTQEDFLAEYGFKTYDEFIEELSNTYRQDLYYTDYLIETIGDETLKAYYETSNVYGDINCKHILVKTSDTVTEEQAKELATTIIAELKAGASWDDVSSKYADKITTEDLGYQSFDSKLEDSFKTALASMANDSYSTEPVQTSYGYHVIYHLDQKDKPSFEDSKKGIVSAMKSELEANDSYLSYKAMLKLEKDNNIKIKDESLKKQYEEYCANIESSATANTTDNTNTVTAE